MLHVPLKKVRREFAEFAGQVDSLEGRVICQRVYGGSFQTYHFNTPSSLMLHRRERDTTLYPAEIEIDAMRDTILLSPRWRSDDDNNIDSGCAAY